MSVCLAGPQTAKYWPCPHWHSTTDAQGTPTTWPVMDSAPTLKSAFTCTAQKGQTQTLLTPQAAPQSPALGTPAARTPHSPCRGQYSTAKRRAPNSGCLMIYLKLPSRSKHWIRPFSLSATHTRLNSSATVTLWGMSNTPGAGAPGTTKHKAHVKMDVWCSD